MEAYEELKRLVEAAADDVAKAEAGNKAAGTRVRKHMQEVKQAAQAVRTTILELRSAKSEGAAGQPGPTAPPPPVRGRRADNGRPPVRQARNPASQLRQACELKASGSSRLAQWP